MTSHQIQNPGENPALFDIGACEREPIHAPCFIQPHGGLLVCELPRWTIAAASANLGMFLGGEASAMLGKSFEDVLPRRIVHDLRNVLQASMVSGTAERLNNVAPGADATPFDMTIHMAGTHVVIECIPRLEPGPSITEPVTLVKSMIGRLTRAPSFERFLQLAANQIRAVSGFDRVMVYKFLDDGSGQVIAEALRSGMAPLLGLRYPASDIPPQARALYRRQSLRLIPEVDYVAVPLLTAEGFREAVDLGLASLRGVSPVHLDYLRNMGSRATLTISILGNQSLWGLFACHHDSPRRIATSACMAVELFGQIFSLQIEAREQAQEFAYAARARETLDRLLPSMPPEETIFDNLGRFIELLKELIPCDGVAVSSGAGLTAIGSVPPPEAFPNLMRFLGQQSHADPFATTSLGVALPEARSYAEATSGLLAIAFKRTPPAFLMFFRREVVQTVTWGGNPRKPVDVTPGGARIGPRKSFEAWRETVRGRSLPWRPGEVQIAEALRISLLEVILRRADLVERERRAAQDNQALLIAELNHRVKNILALIRSLVRQTRQGARTMDDFASDLEQRVRALAMAHDQLTQTGWKQAPLRRLLEAEAKAWIHSPQRVVLAGPPVALGSRAYQTLALVFHEMMTNAAKYGALSRQSGRLSITWARDEAGCLTIEWQEAGGPAVMPPQRRGFGTVITQETIPFELGGEARLDYRHDGVYGKFLVPAAHIGDHEAEAESLTAQVAVLDLNVKRLLLLEDSMMIALDAQAMLRDEGFMVDVAGTVADARRLLAVATFDAGVLDINIGGDTSFAIADAFARLGLPFVFATGYGESIFTPERFRMVPTVSKPYDTTALKAALGLAQRLRDSVGAAAPDGAAVPPSAREPT